MCAILKVLTLALLLPQTIVWVIWILVESLPFMWWLLVLLLVGVTLFYSITRSSALLLESSVDRYIIRDY